MPRSDSDTSMRLRALELMNRLRHEYAPCGGGFSPCRGCRTAQARGGVRCADCLSADLMAVLVRAGFSADEAGEKVAALRDGLYQQRIAVEEMLAVLEDADDAA